MRRLMQNGRSWIGKSPWLRLVAVASFITSCASIRTAPTAPATRTDDVKETLHGVEIRDPYRWLEDQNSPETRLWIDHQNIYSHAMLEAFSGRRSIQKRLEELLKVDSVGVPVERGGRYFFSKRLANQNLNVIYMREGLQGEDEVLIDPHAMSEDQTTSVHIIDVSKDGKLLVYGIREGGEDETSIRILDVDSRANLADRMPKTRYFGVSLTPSKGGFYYTRHGEEGSRVYYHAMGTNPADDIYIFGEGYGPEKIIGSGLSEDGRYLLMIVYYGSAAQRTEVYIWETAGGGPVTPIIDDIEAQFTGEIAEDTLYLKTNWNAPNWKVIAVDLKNPAREAWREIIPETKAVLREFSLAGGRIFVNYLENVHSRVEVFEADGRWRSQIKFPSIGTVGVISGRWNSTRAFFTYSSFHIPTTIYRLETATGGTEVWAKLDAPIDSASMQVRQVWYPSKDGTMIPMFLVHRRGLALNGSLPTLLTGYGGFNISRTPRFSSRAALWVERGGVYALPNLRGGGEFGEQWHRAGMLANKQNVFDDFLAAAQWLIDNGYTNPDKLAISGGSNGGLLVGAALTQRPDLFKAVVCSYPLLDMVRYHKFLVAGFWTPEYGSSEDPDQFEYLYRYSPYHHVKPGTRYPAVLFITGDADTRVAPLHARKMTALLQASTGSDNPILLLYDTKAGHSGGKPLNKIIEDTTDELSFLFWQLSEEGNHPFSWGWTTKWLEWFKWPKK